MAAEASKFVIYAVDKFMLLLLIFKPDVFNFACEAPMPPGGWRGGVGFLRNVARQLAGARVVSSTPPGGRRGCTTFVERAARWPAGMRELFRTRFLENVAQQPHTARRLAGPHELSRACRPEAGGGAFITVASGHMVREALGSIPSVSMAMPNGCHKFVHDQRARLGHRITFEPNGQSA